MLKRLLLLLALLPGPAQAAPWVMDPETRVEVDVLWQGQTVVVRFPRLSGTIDFDADRPDTASAGIAVSARDATTGVPVVDALVRSRDYLGAEAHPTITFQLDALRQTSSSTAEILGQITLRGVTRPARFAAKVFRYGPSPQDADRFEAGFDLTGEIDRTAFGSTGGLPDVPAILPVRIHLLMRSR